ncbi:MAG: hypothetical protein IT426_19400 [Pirellulales bacterium]|nr:hypothetical protein [Pirellulales bacterium]
MIPDVIVAISPVMDALEMLGAPYYIGGSVASSAHGMVRGTVNADLIADLKFEHVSPLAEILGKEYYLNVDTITDAVRGRTCFNLIHLATMFKVDVFAAKSSPYSRLPFARKLSRAILEDSPRLFFIASPEDTILSKLEWYRLGDEISERQWTDVLGVMKAQGEILDRAYLQKWAVELHVADLLEKAWKAARS